MEKKNKQEQEGKKRTNSNKFPCENLNEEMNERLVVDVER